MKILFVIVAFAMLPQTVLASDWVLWQTLTLSENVLPDKTPLEEFTNLKACRNALYKAVEDKIAYLRSEQPSSEITNLGEAVGVRFKNKSGTYTGAVIRYECFPSGKTP